MYLYYVYMYMYIHKYIIRNAKDCENTIVAASIIFTVHYCEISAGVACSWVIFALGAWQAGAAFDIP